MKIETFKTFFSFSLVSKISFNKTFDFLFLFLFLFSISNQPLSGSAPLPNDQLLEYNTASPNLAQSWTSRSLSHSLTLSLSRSPFSYSQIHRLSLSLTHSEKAFLKINFHLKLQKRMKWTRWNKIFQLNTEIQPLGSNLMVTWLFWPMRWSKFLLRLVTPSVEKLW